MIVRLAGVALAIALLFCAPVARAQKDLAAADQIAALLLERSGAPSRFTTETTDQMITVHDTASGLRCEIPVRAPHMNLSVTDQLMQCGYTGGVIENWMVLPPSNGATHQKLEDVVAAYALFQKDQRPTLQVLNRGEAPPPIAALAQIYPNAAHPFRIWMRDSQGDWLVSVAGADVDGYRIIQYVAGPSDPVAALSELSFATSVPQPAPHP